MPDYIYLLENRLSVDQRNALRHLREVARDAGTILFLTGSAVRDLTSGHAVRELEVAVHGNALKLKKPLEKAGGKVWGEDDAARTLYLCFPGTVRVDLVSTHRVEYPKPGKPVPHWASIQEDLRRRDFTVNAMAISLNEGSYGLLMDPLNGAADIEARTLRLVSNYGFLDEPALMIRATRYRVRLGWELDTRTQARYDNAREEGLMDHLSAVERSRELEQIGHEDDGLKVLRALEAEGWMKVLFPAWTSAKADEDKLRALHDLSVELLLQGVHADMSAAQMHLLTAKLAPKDLTALKKQMLRHGFVDEWNSLDSMAAAFSKVLLAKENQTPSAAFKLFTSYDPEAVLWLGFTVKAETVRERYRLFLKEWPEARQRTPHLQMQEMRITPDLPTYAEIVHRIFLELIDGHLNSPEEIRAFLEPFSPPAPPPQVTIKRSRARRSAEVRVKERSFEDEDESDEDSDDEIDLDDIGADDEEAYPDMETHKGDDEDDAGDEDEEDSEEEKSHGPKHGKKHAPAKGAAAKSAVKAPVTPAPKAEAKSAKPAHAAKPAAAAPATKKQEAAKPAPAKPSAKTPAKPAAKTPAKPAPKAAVKVPAKPPMKAATKSAPAKKPAAPAKAAHSAPKKLTKPAPKAPAKKAATKPSHSAAKGSAKAAPAKKPAAKATRPAKPPAKKAAAKPARKR
ncbi:MAG TPA: hypothetical protein VMV57_01260 [Terracidiphilus sp.]|nr:hypothetical protein [Terracidiphilus sp.]